MAFALTGLILHNFVDIYANQGNSYRRSFVELALTDLKFGQKIMLKISERMLMEFMKSMEILFLKRIFMLSFENMLKLKNKSLLVICWWRFLCHFYEIKFFLWRCQSSLNKSDEKASDSRDFFPEKSSPLSLPHLEIFWFL